MVLDDKSRAARRRNLSRTWAALRTPSAQSPRLSLPWCPRRAKTCTIGSSSGTTAWQARRRWSPCSSSKPRFRRSVLLKPRSWPSKTGMYTTWRAGGGIDDAAMYQTLRRHRRRRAYASVVLGEAPHGGCPPPPPTHAGGASAPGAERRSRHGALRARHDVTRRLGAEGPSSAAFRKKHLIEVRDVVCSGKPHRSMQAAAPPHLGAASLPNSAERMAPEDSVVGALRSALSPRHGPRAERGDLRVPRRCNCSPRRARRLGVCGPPHGRQVVGGRRWAMRRMPSIAAQWSRRRRWQSRPQRRARMGGPSLSRHAPDMRRTMRRPR